MSGCFTDLELHPQGPADVAALARAEAHAEGCADCAQRLAELRAVDGLLAGGLGRFTTPSACPDPEDLAAWIDAGRPDDDVILVAHLASCAECRADLLEALDDDAADAPAADAPVRAPSRRSRRLAQPRRAHPRVLEVAVAAAVLALSVAWWVASRPEQVDPRLVATRPAPRLSDGAPTPIKVPTAPRPTRAPAPAPTRAPQPTPAPQPTTAPETPAPRATPEPPTPSPAPTAAPSPAPTPAPTPTPATSPSTAPTQAPTPRPTPTPAIAALAVTETVGLARKDDRGRYQAFQAGELPAGAELHASSRGGRLQTAGGLLLLAPRSRVTWSGQLTLTHGKLLVEGRDVRVGHALGAVRVRGRALLEAKKRQVGVTVLFGRASVEREGDEPAELTRGAWWAAARKKAARTGRTPFQRGQPPGLPTWAGTLHPNPTGGLRGRPGRRGRGGPGAGPPPRRPRGGPGTGAPPPRGPRSPGRPRRSR